MTLSSKIAAGLRWLLRDTPKEARGLSVSGMLAESEGAKLTVVAEVEARRRLLLLPAAREIARRRDMSDEDAEVIMEAGRKAWRESGQHGLTEIMKAEAERLARSN